MSPRTVVQNKIIREEKKDLILRTALKVFAQEGYHASSVNKIADKANISKGLIYNYFESKEDVLKTIIFDIADSILEKYPEGNFSLTNLDIEYFIDKSIDFVLDDTTRAKLLFSISSQPGVMDIIFHKMMEKALPFMNLLTDYFKNNKAEEPQVMMYYFLSVLDGVQMHMITNSAFPVEKIRLIIKKQFLKS